MKQTRLLIIAPVPPPRGGVSIHIERFSHQLELLGIVHEILNESRIETSGFKHMRTISPLGYLKTVLQASHIHIHSSNCWVRLAHTTAGWILRRRIIQTFHSSRGAIEALVSRACAALSDQVIAVSADVAAQVWNRAIVAPAFLAPLATEFEIEPAVDDWIQRTKAKGKKLISVSAFNTAQFGEVDLYGIDLILEAFADAAFRSEFGALICISVPAPRPERLECYRDAIKESGLSEDVLILVGQRPFLGVMSKSDVFVRPTNTDGDALSVREALWLGVACAASDAASRPREALLFRSRDLEDMKATIRKGAVTSPPRMRSEFLGIVLEAYKSSGIVTAVAPSAIVRRENER